LTRRMPDPKVVSSIELVTNPPTQSSSTNTHSHNFKVEWVGGGWRDKKERDVWHLDLAYGALRTLPCILGPFNKHPPFLGIAKSLPFLYYIAMKRSGHESVEPTPTPLQKKMTQPPKTDKFTCMQW
jgi:hypothetical protein